MSVWATVYGRNLSGFGDKTGFAFFFRFTGGTSRGAFFVLFFHVPLYAGVQFARLICSILMLHLLRETNCINRSLTQIAILILFYSHYCEHNWLKEKRVKALKIKARKKYTFDDKLRINVNMRIFLLFFRLYGIISIIIVIYSSERVG